MQAVQRRRKILEQLRERGSLAVKEIVDHFCVSKMTVHRDLELLEERGQVRRIFGGAVPVTQTGAVNDSTTGPVGERCLICYRPASAQLLYIMTLRSGERQVACCPHCGITAHLSQGDEIVMAMTADYLSGRLHSAQYSWFLWESAAAPCCQPSILTFENDEMALRFQTGFGGQLGQLDEAIEFLRLDAKLHGGESCPHCSGNHEKI